MSRARYVVGDVLDVLRTLPEDSVDLVFSSPPFLGLRSYLPAEHPDKAKEIGSESTPGEFIDTLCLVAEECARVLAPHGSLCFELGDTYAGSGGGGGDYLPGGLRDGQPGFAGSAQASKEEHTAAAAHWRRKNAQRDAWPLDKSLSLIPELFRITLAYGVNPLTGRETEPWRIRNVVRWHRPNPPVGALGDKFRPATSDVVVACKSRTRYFDLDAVRYDSDYHRGPVATREVPGKTTNTSLHTVNPAGAPPLDTWIIPTAPYKGSHYATFPPALVVKPVLSMCPERVCTVCGEPSRRVTDISYSEVPDRPLRDDDARRYGSIDGKRHNDHRATRHTTLGWTDCGHNSWRPGLTLDPFAGSGTTLAVATGHGRDAIGIDLDARNADLARERVGMFLTVESTEALHA